MSTPCPSASGYRVLRQVEAEESSPDTPSKVDATVLVAIRAADLIIMPTRAGLFDVAALKDTVKLLEMADDIRAFIRDNESSLKAKE